MNNNTISKSYYNEIVNKIIEISLISLNKESKYWIDIICTKIKVCELQKQHLLENKPLFFQKAKLEKHNKKVEAIDNKIMKYFKDIEEELEYIENKCNIAVNFGVNL